MHKGFYKAALSILIILYTDVISFGQAGVVPLSTPTGGFRIDGYLERQTTAGDWVKGNAPLDAPGSFLFSSAGASLYPRNTYRITDLFNDQINDDIFGKGKFQDDPNIMTWRSNKPQSRHDINSQLLHITQDVNGHYWVILGIDRFGNSGDSYIDIEFLQNIVAKTGGPIPGGTGGFISEGPHGGRTIGDIVITANFQSDLAAVYLYRWVATGTGTYGYVPVLGEIGGVFSSSNSTVVNVPYGAFGSTTYQPNSFMEVAIDMTALGVLVVDNCGNNLGRSFKTLWIKSRSSAANNANLLDFSAPLQLSSLTGETSLPSGYSADVSYTFYDLNTAQLNAVVSPPPQEDYNFLWEAVGAVVGNGQLAIDPTVTGTLSNYEIANPVFIADPNYYCINYLYYLNVFRKSDGCIVARVPVLIQSPCKIGKPINPDRIAPKQNKLVLDDATNNIIVYPNPGKGIVKLILPNDDTRDIELMSLNGSIIQRWHGVKSRSIESRSLASGVYLLKIISRTTGEVITKKIMIAQ